MEQNKRTDQPVTVFIPRDLWSQLKHEAWRRKSTAKKMLAEAIERALERWKKEHVQL